jgi:hypothetical protein
MRKYWIAFIVIITFCLGWFGTIIYKCFIEAPKPVVVYLDVDSLKEAGNSIITDTPNIVAVYPSNHINTINDTLPWADVYVCNSYSKKDSLSGDTAVMILDIHTRPDLKNIVFTDESFGSYFQAGIQVGKKVNICRILVPPSKVDYIKRYRYKLGYVKLIPIRIALD